MVMTVGFAVGVGVFQRLSSVVGSLPGGESGRVGQVLADSAEHGLPDETTTTVLDFRTVGADAEVTSPSRGGGPLTGQGGDTSVTVPGGWECPRAGNEGWRE